MERNAPLNSQQQEEVLASVPNGTQQLHAHAARENPLIKFFPQLPSVIVSALVSQWLDAEDVVHFDSAYCNKEERAVFYEAVISSPGCLLRQPSRIASRAQFQHWAVLRGAQLN